MPEHAERLLLYTTAPAVYDGFSTVEEFPDIGRDDRGHTIRLVNLERRDLEWQTTRYASGLHAWTTPDEAALFPTIWKIALPPS